MSQKETPETKQAAASVAELSRDHLRSYVVGFGLSLILTLVAYLLVRGNLPGHNAAFTRDVLTAAVLTLAIAQLFVQLSFFFHIDQERKPRLNGAILAFAAIVVFILVAGSLWIMANLNHNMNMTPAQMDKYMQNQDGL